MPPSDRSAPEPGQIEARPRTHLVLPLLAIAGLFAVVMLASSLQGLPQFSAPMAEPDGTVSIGPEPTPSGTPAPPMEPPEDSLLLNILAAVMGVVAGALILTLAYFGIRMLVRFLARLWRDRPLARQQPTEVSGDVAPGPAIDSEPDSATIRRGIAEAVRTIEERRQPGDAIIAAWVGLEETAADAGAGRGVNETPSEFTMRIVGRRSGIAGDVTALLDLYERVRFGGHPADEADRAAAFRSLQGIEAGWR